MPQKVIRFKGINRHINEFYTSGECEELINLRPLEDGCCNVVRSKWVEYENVPYDKIYEHTWGDKYNRLAVINNGPIVWLNTKTNTSVIITGDFQGKDVEISSAGNVLVIYCAEDKKQLVFKFEDGAYQKQSDSLKSITDAKIAYSVGTTYNSVTAEDDSVGAMNEALQKAASGFHHEYPNGLCGYAVVGCAYELEDGQEVWSTAFIVANSELTIGYQEPSINTDTKVASVSGAKQVYLCVDFAGINTSGVKRINIYASRPVFPYVVENSSSTNLVIKKIPLDEINLGGQQMYYQRSINPNEVSAKVLLNFGAEQTGEALMKVTAGCIDRIGKNISYNNRFHFFQSETQHVIQVPTVSTEHKYFIISPTTDNKTEFYDYGDGEDQIVNHWIAYVKINNEWKLINKEYKFSELIASDFIYPMANVKQLAFVKANYENGSMSVPYETMFYVDLNDSSAYNYSYAFDVTPSLVDAGSFYNEVSASGQIWGNPTDEKTIWEKETNEINVSAPFNPLVFPVEYSYGFGGEIIDITTAYTPISATQVGQYPITVFTTNGIYALEQGNGAVLYSNVTPLQPHVISGKATPTQFGTVFASANNIYVLSGREAINISHIMTGDRYTDVKATDAYRHLCYNKENKFFDFSNYVSMLNFERFIQSATFVYDQINNELIISRKDTRYSYVFNLNTKSYHKITKSYLPAQKGARYVIEIENDTRNMVDLHNDSSTLAVPIMLESRPMSLGALYSHIQRLMFLADATLDSSLNHSLCVSVFAGDNLHDWKCIISSQKHNAILSHIRTNRAAKSYKHYVVVINGIVSSDTNLSDLIVDYTVVNRRLG